VEADRVEADRVEADRVEVAYVEVVAALDRCKRDFATHSSTVREPVLQLAVVVGKGAGVGADADANEGVARVEDWGWATPLWIQLAATFDIVSDPWQGQGAPCCLRLNLLGVGNGVASFPEDPHTRLSIESVYASPMRMKKSFQLG
jgi:hypothetical protein